MFKMPLKVRRRIPDFTFFLSLVFVGGLASGCAQLSYLTQAGLGQWALYNHERPVDEVLRDPSTPQSVREKLAWIAEMKKWVELEMSIPATKNYTTYVDLKRPYVIWAITVAEPYALKLRTWSFPIVGEMPYLGFFAEDKANAWIADYSKQGFDTAVRGVGAYSTLGYLRDPLLSSMLSRRKSDMLNLIAHETAHTVIYLKGQGSFNEQAASFIGDLAEKTWIQKTYGVDSRELKDWGAIREDRRRFGILLRAFSEELKRFYSSTETAPAAERLREKRARFSAFQKRLEDEDWSFGGRGSSYAKFASIVDNNAALLAVLTYEDDQHVFDLIEQRCRGALKCALERLVQFSNDWGRLSSQDRESKRPQDLLFEQLRASRD